MPEIRVECYAGYRANERPLRFTLRGHVFQVVEVEDRWYSPGAVYFRVQADDGNFYILCPMRAWTLGPSAPSGPRTQAITTPSLATPQPIAALLGRPESVKGLSGL